MACSHSGERAGGRTGPTADGGNQSGCDWWKRIKDPRAEANSVNGLGRGRERTPGWERGRSPPRQFRRVALRVPDLDAVGIFLLGDDVHGRDELQRASLAADLATQAFEV